MLLALASALTLHAATPAPDAWVPMRWPWADAASLALLDESPVNCLLVAPTAITKPFLDQAKTRGVVVFAAAGPGQLNEAQAAMERGASGIAIVGDPPAAERERLRALSKTLVEFVPRIELAWTSGKPILATEQGVWPGVNLQENSAAHSAPSGAPWIDTNSGFLRFARASAPEAVIWIGIRPPAGQVISAERYLQVIGDAAMMGARWVISLDSDLESRIAAREDKALKAWRKIGAVLGYYEQHPEWRRAVPHGQLAVVQDVASGGVLSGGILDMISVKHTPVRAIPPERLAPAAFGDSKMTVNAAVDSLTPAQKDALRNFTRSGGTLLTGPPGWRMPAPRRDQITLDKEDIEKLDQIWKEVNTMTGRRNLGVRLFNVSSMMSNLSRDPQSGKLILQLVNYSDYPVDSIAVHVLGVYKQARVLRPGRPPQPLKPYENEDGVGFDIDLIESVATLEIE